MLKYSDYKKMSKEKDDNQIVSYAEYAQSQKAKRGSEIADDWFKRANSYMADYSRRASDYPQYNYARNTATTQNKLTSFLGHESDDVNSYIESLKYSAPNQYKALSDQYRHYKKGINAYLDYTKDISDFASQFKSEDEYNKGVKKIKTAQKYSGLKSYDDYMNALRNAKDEEEKGYLAQMFAENKKSNTTSPVYQRYVSQLIGAPNEETKKGLISRAPLLGTSEEIKKYISDREFSGEATEGELGDLYNALKLREQWENTDEGKLNRFYYDLPLDERNDIYHYIEHKDGKVLDLSEGSEKEKQRLLRSPDPLQETIRINAEKGAALDNRVNQLAHKLNTTPEELAKWYQRGEKNDEAKFENEKAAEWAEEHPIVSSFASVIEKPARDFMTVGKYIEALGTDDHYVDTSALPNARTDVIRETVGDKIDNPIGRFFYDSGMSTADSAWNMALGGLIGNAVASSPGKALEVGNKIGDIVTLTPAFTGAATGTANRVIESGGSYDQAVLSGLASGIAEVFFEKISLDQLKVFETQGASSFQDVIKNVAKGMFTEGSEEVATDIANLVTDTLINGGLSEMGQNIKKYIDEGSSAEEAERKAWGDFSFGLVQSFAGGAMGGALFSGAATNANYLANYANDLKNGKLINQKGNAERIADIASTYRDGSNSAQYARKLNKQFDKKSKAHNHTLGRAYSSIMSDSLENNSEEVRARLGDYKNGLTKQEGAIVDKLIDGKDLNDNDIKLAESSGKLKEVVDKVVNIHDMLAENVARASYSLQDRLDNFGAVEVKDLKLAHDNMTTEEKASSLIKYAKEHNLDRATTNAMVENYKDDNMKLNVDDYATQFIAYNNYGRTSFNKPQIREDIYSINEEAKAAAYNAGQESYRSILAAKNQLTKVQTKQLKKNSGYREGSVDMSKINYRKLTNDQQNAVKLVNRFAKYSGVNVEWYTSIGDQSGKITEPNGYYNPENNTVALDTNAGRKSITDALAQGAIVSTFSHELTHIAEHDTDNYLSLRNALKNAVGDEKWDAAVQNQRERFVANHPDTARNMTADEITDRAISEATAEYCSGLFKDSDLIIQIAKENPSLKRSFKKVIDKIIVKLKKLCNEIKAVYGARNEYAEELESSINDLEDIRKQWEKAVKQGVKNQNAKQAVKGISSDTGVQELARDARKSNSGRANSQNESDRGRASAKTQQYQDRKAEQIDSVYLAAVENGDTETAQRLVDEAAKAAGYTIKAYHGTPRADRVGNVFRPERATSGPMAYFTDSKEIAGNYARDKSDTSIAYDSDYDSYYTQFRVKRGNKTISVSELWNTLPYSEKQKIKERARHIKFDEDLENIIYDKNAKYGNGNVDDYTFNMHRGNALDVLIDSWLESGDLWGNEEMFLDVLKLAGVDGVEYFDPDYRDEKVYETYLNISNPYDTSTVDNDFIRRLEDWWSEQDEGEYYKDSSGADMWDKNSMTVEDFVNRLRDDLESNTSHAWTSIPDAITAFIKAAGYNGIKDTGGKNGGDSHTVWIPFSPEQIKSADAVTYDDNGEVIPLSERFKAENKDIRYQDRDSISSEDELLANASAVKSAMNFSTFDLDDDDLFDDFDEVQKDRFDKMVEEDPAEAMRLVMASAIRSSAAAINSNVSLTSNALRLISNKVALDYAIDSEQAPRIGEALTRYIHAVKNGDDAVAAFESFNSDMRDIALEINIEPEIAKERREQIKSVFKDRILDIHDRELPDIISHYDTWANFKSKMAKYGLNVRQKGQIRKRDILGNAMVRGTDINSLLDDLNYELGYDAYNGVGVTESTDGSDAVIQLDEFLSREFSPDFYNNPYLSGEAENIDIVAAEISFDTLGEYLKRQGQAVVSGSYKPKTIKEIRDLRNKVSTLKKSLKKTEKNLLNSENAIKRAHSVIDSINNYSAEIADLDKQIDSEYNKIVTDNKKIAKLESDREVAANRLEAKRKELNRIKVTRGVGNVIKSAKQEAVRETQKQWAKKLSEVRKEKNDRIKELENQPRRERAEIKKEIREEYVEARTLTEVVNKIKKLGLRMGKMLTNPNNKLYVPTAFRESFLDACNAVAWAMDGEGDTEVSKKINDLRTLLGDMNKGYHGSDYIDEFGDEIMGEVEAAAKLLNEKLEEKKIDRKSLTLAEANDIYDLLLTIYNTVHDATIQLGERDGMTNRASGERIIEQTQALKDSGYAKYVKIKHFKSLVLNSMRAARMYTGYNDDSELMYHMNMLERGQRKSNSYIMGAEKIFHELTENKANKKAYDDFQHKILTVKYEDHSGKKHIVKITPSMGVQILMSWEREMLERKLKHMQKGGIKIPKAELIAKGKYKEALDKCTTIRAVNQSLYNAINAELSDFDKEFKEAAEKYFNEYSKEHINEVSNILKHRDIATSAYYIPFYVNQNELVKELDSIKFDYSLENMGMLKTLQHNAPQTIIISGMNNVISRHISDTAKLYGLAVPIRNFKKALNVTTKETVTLKDGTELEIPSGSIRDTINNVWGNDVNIFFGQIITDLQKSREQGSDMDNSINKATNALREAMIVKTLTGNISVAIKQAASYPTAGLYLSAGSLNKGLVAIKDIVSVKNHKFQALFDEIDAHTASHYMRRQGLTIPELNEISNSWSGKVIKKIPTAINPAKWIQGMDVLTTAVLWKGTRAEIDSKYKKAGKTLGTDEYWNEVTDLYDRILEDTQPMYDTLHRAEMSKTSDRIVKYLFMFRTQPLQNAGIIFDAFCQMRAKKDAASKTHFARACASQASSMAVFAIMNFAAGVALFKIKRYMDEDDEVTPTSVIMTILQDMGSTTAGILAPIGGSELYDAIRNLMNNKNYGFVNVPPFEMINDTWDSLSQFYKTAQSEYEELLKSGHYSSDKVGAAFAKAVSDIAGFKGIPSQNLYNIANSAWNYLVEHNNPFESDDHSSPKECALSYGRNFTKGDIKKARTQLATLYQAEFEKQKTICDTTDKARQKAAESVRSSLSNAYKSEYQSAFLRSDTVRLKEIEQLLKASGYMIYKKNKSLNDVLKEWQKYAWSDSNKIPKEYAEKNKLTNIQLK